MAFQLKDFVSIAASMINRAKATQDKVTDFNIGGVARTMLEAPAIEIEEFYQRMFAGIIEAIPTAIYKGFDFERVEATYARGYIRVYFGGQIAEPFVVPAGTIFASSSNGLRYLSVEDVSVEVGMTSVSILVGCAQTGAVGNAGVGVVDSVVGFDFPAGSSLINELITSGSNGETEEERKARFVSLIQTLARGTNGAVEYAARSAQVVVDGNVVEYVTRVGFVEVPGTMDVFIYGADIPASQRLIDAAQQYIDGYWDEDNQTFVPGYRPVGVRVRVFGMSEHGVDAVFTVEMLPGIAMTAAVVNDIKTRIGVEIRAVRAGGVLYTERLRDAVLAAPGVKSVRTNLSANIICEKNVALVPGVISVVEGDA